MRKISTCIYATFFCFFVVAATTQLNAQLSGTKTVGLGGGEDYASLTDAFTNIGIQSLNGNIVLQLTANYDFANEPGFPIVAPPKVSIGLFTVNV